MRFYSVLRLYFFVFRGNSEAAFPPCEFRLKGEVGIARKKKSAEDEVRDGLKKIAFGDISDALTLLFCADDEKALEKLGELDLFNISKIKRPKGGGMEIEFYDRIKALEKLGEISCQKSGDAEGFYSALENSVKSVRGLFGGDGDE